MKRQPRYPAEMIGNQIRQDESGQVWFRPEKAWWALTKQEWEWLIHVGQVRA